MTAQAIDLPTTLTFTGERMVPHASDIATELFHWQRYLFFKPWYEDKKVVDAASGEGYGTNYIANFAESAIGVEIASDAIMHARCKYAKPQFVQGDVCAYDYSDADLVVSFETIEHLDDPSAFLKAVSACKGNIVISTPNRDTHSPGNSVSDKPLNHFHTIEWTPTEFAKLIEEHFPGRTIRFMSQQGFWPGTIKEGLDDSAMYVIAVIGDGDLPKWPRIGIAVPTHNGANRCRDLVVSMTRYYPGDLEFALVDNGSNPEESEALDRLQGDFPSQVHIIHLSANVGYGLGANAGLNYLWQEGWFDYFCVTNDDVTPSVECLSQVVSAMQELEAGGHKPGVVGPATNNISGLQAVDIGDYQNYAEMLDFAELWHREHHSVGTQVVQLRGLFMLIHPDCLSAVGGFDPRFGIGNFEDDDHNLRTRLAGFSIWIAEGAFLHHQGSSTFNELGVDYHASMQRNHQLICEKWSLKEFEEFTKIDQAPEGVELFIPLTASYTPSKYLMALKDSEAIDLVGQASDVEFAAYVYHRIKGKPRNLRLAIIRHLEKSA
ncbi:MAG TPA: glycosyltransferase [Fimbriimonadaceae bacterium]|nr:glycosyltransferase [Fimbriimonadaceae bacterium]